MSSLFDAIQPDDGQSFNPYSYVMNNPLKYTDPSGYVSEKTQEGQQGKIREEIKEKVKQCPEGQKCTVQLKDSSGKVVKKYLVDNGAKTKASTAATPTAENTTSTDSTTNASSTSLAQQGLSFVLDAASIVGGLKGAGQVVAGEDLVTGESLNRWTAAGFAILGLVGLKGFAKAGDAIDIGESAIKQIKQGDSVQAAAKTADWFAETAKQATVNPNSKVLVLGHFTDTGKSYQKVAAHYKATYFKVKNWAKVTEGLSRNEIWQINEAFLKQQLSQNKQILFSHNPMNARSGSFFEKEVKVLSALGYKFQQNTQWTWEAIR